MLMMVGIVLLPSCDQKREFVANEKRELTTLDAREVELEVTSKQRFEPPTEMASLGMDAQEPAPHGLDFVKPEGWTEAKATMFRNINFTIDAGGEAYVSLVGGQVLGNINRWYGQFGEKPRTMAELEAGEKVSILGRDAYLVKASGTYNAGMGKPLEEGVTLLGAVTTTDTGLLTVKLIAPIEVASTQEEVFKAFCNSLQNSK